MRKPIDPQLAIIQNALEDHARASVPPPLSRKQRIAIGLRGLLTIILMVIFVGLIGFGPPRIQLPLRAIAVVAAVISYHWFRAAMRDIRSAGGVKINDALAPADFKLMRAIWQCDYAILKYAKSRLTRNADTHMWRGDTLLTTFATTFAVVGTVWALFFAPHATADNSKGATISTSLLTSAIIWIFTAAFVGRLSIAQWVRNPVSVQQRQADIIDIVSERDEGDRPVG